jgi:hypothetical protein
MRKIEQKINTSQNFALCYTPKLLPKLAESAYFMYTEALQISTCITPIVT